MTTLQTAAAASAEVTDAAGTVRPDGLPRSSPQLRRDALVRRETMDQAASARANGSDSRFPVGRSGKYLRPDNSRMLLRPFLPGGDRRVREIIERILGMSASEVEAGLQDVKRCLSHEHAGIEAIFSLAIGSLLTSCRRL